jgi:hypothetical protein
MREKNIVIFELKIKLELALSVLVSSSFFFYGTCSFIYYTFAQKRLVFAQTPLRFAQ